MPRSPFATQIYDTPQKSSRNGSVPRYVVIHHAASTSFSGVVQMELGAKEVSSTLIIDGPNIASMMDESYRAWSLSSALWDGQSLSVETINNSGAPGWTISEASYRSLAKVVADWCRRYSIPCNRDRVLGHREVYSRHGASYATACPGGIDLDRVVRDANALTATITAGTTQTTIQEDDMFTDEDRALLHQAARAANLPVLVKTADSPKVWLSNLVTRRLVASVAELGRVQASLASRGLDGGVNTVQSLDVFGVPTLTGEESKSLTAAQVAGTE